MIAARKYGPNLGLTGIGGIRLHTMENRVEAFKELMRRASRWDGRWVMYYFPEYRAFTVGAEGRPQYSNSIAIASCVAPAWGEPRYLVTLLKPKKPTDAKPENQAEKV